MKKNSIYKNTKIRTFGILLIGTLALYPTMAFATGWETVSRGSSTCGGSGLAHTVEVEEFWFLGIKWSTRTTYRDGNNNVLEGSPCGSGGGPQQ